MIGDNIEHILTPRRAELLSKRGVRGYSTVRQRRLRGGQETDEEVVRVYVDRKVPKETLRPEDLVPADIEGLPTDVVEVGDVSVQWRWPWRRQRPPVTFGATIQLFGAYTKRVRPIVPGYSIGHSKITAGTAGALGILRDWPVVLSNSHVLALSNTKQHARAKVYDQVLQPGPFDGGQEGRDTIGWLAGWVPLDEEGVNNADLAWAWVSKTAGWNGAIEDIGWLRGRREPETGMVVQKTGRTTGHTAGKRIFDPAGFLSVNYGFAKLQFEDIVLVQPMSSGGDSGSLILTDPGREAVGVLFAGSELMTVGCKLTYLPPDIALVAAV
jgi:hypothetical protein